MAEKNNSKQKRGSHRVLVIYNHNSSWLRDDIRLLSKHFDVETFFYKRDKKQKNLSSLVKNADIVYVWFASYHGLKAAYLAKKYEKKVITVASGYSVANVSQYNYGLASKFYTRWIPKYILKNSDVVIAVSESNKKEILHLMKNKADVIVIPHGFDKEKYRPDEKIKKERIVITVGGLDRISWKRKGIDRFISVARHFPDAIFMVIGKIKDDVKDRIKNVSSNVKFTGYVSDQELLKFYQKAKVYVQFSFHEAFGCSVAEAMLCNCIPVVTDIGSLPEVVGDTGFYVPYWSQDAAVQAINKAFNAPEKLGDKASIRVTDKFSLGTREEKLRVLIEGMVR